jgi:hypothetical protein
MTGWAYPVTNLHAQGGDARLWVTWTPTPGIPSGINYYVYAYDTVNPGQAASSCGAPSVTNGVAMSYCQLTGLANSHQYTVTLYMCYVAGGCSGNYGTGPVTVARWPDPVSNLVVTGGNNSITATWSPPANNGGLAVSRYVAALYPATAGYAWCYTTLTANASVTNTRVTFSPATAALYGHAPVNGTGYRVTVFAVNNTIDGYVGNPDCTPSAGVSQDVSSADVAAEPVSGWQPAESGQYTPVTPMALLQAGGTPIAAGQTLSMYVRGIGTIPATGVSAVTLGVSMTQSAAGASLYLWNFDATMPTDPVLHTNPGGAATTVTVPVGATGAVRVSSTVAGVVSVDALGYFSDATVTTAGSRYMSMTPTGLYSGTVRASVAQPVTVKSDFGLVAGIRPDAIALEVALQASGSSTSGSLTLQATGSTAPDTPALYYTPGQVSSAVTQVSVASGPLLILASAGTLTLQLQVIGYYTGPLDPSGSRFSAAAQTRVSTASIAPGSSVTVPRPAGAPAASTEWLLVNASGLTAAGTLSVYPNGIAAQTVTVGVSTAANAAVLIPVPDTSPDGSVVIASDTAAGTVTVDVAGYTIPGSVPGPASGVQAAPLASGAYISWFAPCVDGGAPVSSYQIVALPGGNTLTVDGTQTYAFMYGLTDGTSYVFEVFALNAAGAGTGSALSPPVIPAATVPDPPDQAGAQAGDASALVSWDTPVHNGDSAITGYTITATDGSSYSVSGVDTHQLVVTGLANGTAYRFQVAATNAVGTGQPSLASISVTPTAGAPLAPALVRMGPTISSSATAVTTCSPLAPLSSAPTRANPDLATTTRYQLGDHVLTMTTPPASLDLATATLAMLHTYGYAQQIHTDAALATWQHRIGHSHAVAAVPCLTPGHTRSSESTRAAAGICLSTTSGSPSVSESGPNPIRVYFDL